MKQILLFLQKRYVSAQSDTTQMYKININPAESLFDQKINVSVTGLCSDKNVTLFLSTQQEWQKKCVEFMSCAQFIASKDGEIDLARDASFGGSYEG